MSDTLIPVCAGPRLASAPSFALPPGACDTHAHVFGPARHYPYQANRTYSPPDALAEDYAQLLVTLGFSRAVLVQPSVYGTDNRLLCDVLAQSLRGEGAFAEKGLELRAVAVVTPGITDQELAQLHALGVRGLRANLLYKGGVEIAAAAQLARRVAAKGWHMQFLVDLAEISGLAALIRALPVPAVIDHMGHMPTSHGIAHPAFQELLELLCEGKTWVKLSGSYRFTSEDHCPYSDVVPFAQALVAANPERLLYGTDWPHPFVSIPMPDDGPLLDQLLDWAPDPALRHKILVDNAAELYGF